VSDLYQRHSDVQFFPTVIFDLDRERDALADSVAASRNCNSNRQRARL